MNILSSDFFLFLTCGYGQETGRGTKTGSDAAYQIGNTPNVEDTPARRTVINLLLQASFTMSILNAIHFNSTVCFSDGSTD